MTAPAVSAQRVAILLGLLVALTVIGSSAVAVALPTVAQEFGLDTSGTAWILIVFSLAFSIATAIFGRVADLHGLRRPLVMGVTLLAIGSVAAAAAPSYPLLLLARVVQGAGSGAVPVLAVGVIAARYSGDARAAALGAVTAVVTIVSGSGPLLGGAIAEVAGWRGVLALPGLAILLVRPVARFAPAEPAGKGRVDWIGAVLVAYATTGAVLLLQSPATGGHPAMLFAGIGLLSVGLAGVIVNVRGRPDGFLPRGVVTNRRLLASCVTGTSLLASYLGSLVALPTIFFRAFGWSPLRIGLVLFPAALIGSVASRMLGGAAERIGRRRLSTAMAVSAAFGLLLAAFAAPSPVTIVAGFALVATGFAAGQVALLDGVPTLVRPEVRGAALGVFNLLFFTGGAIGSAVVGGVGQATTLATALAVLAVLPAIGAVAARFS